MININWPTLKNPINKKSKKSEGIGIDGAEIKTPKEKNKVTTEQLQNEMARDLDISGIFSALDNYKSDEKVGAVFAEILEESKNQMLSTNDIFLTKLNDAKLAAEGNPDYKYDEQYFLDKRPEFLAILCRSHFFSNISPEKYAEFKKYTSLLGKMKDAGKFKTAKDGKPRHESLITDNPEIISVIRNLQPGNLNTLKQNYESTVNNILRLMELPKEELDEDQFHYLRKDLRYCVYVIEALMDKLGLSEQYLETTKKLRHISGKLAKTREITGLEEGKTWKGAMKKILTKANELFDSEQRTRKVLAHGENQVQPENTEAEV